jgi:CHAT domain-containing protein
MKRPLSALGAGLAALLAAAAHGQQTSPVDSAQASMQAAVADSRRGAYADALADLDHALALFRQVGDQNGEAQAELGIGEINEGLHTAEGNAKAIAAFTQAIPLFAATHDPYDQATAASGVAVAMALVAKVSKEEARDAYKNAIALLDAPDRARERAQMLIGLSGMEQALGDSGQARSHAEQALELLTGPRDARGRANALMSRALACETLEDVSCAADSFLRAADAQHALGGAQGAQMEALARQRGATAVMRLAKSREGQGDASGAIAGYARAAGAWRMLGNSDMETAAQLGVGRLRQADGDWDGAETAYDAALAAAGDGQMKVAALGALAMVAAQRGDHQRALDLAEKALPLLAASGDAWRRAGLLLLAGNAAAGVHLNVRAVQYYKEAESLGDVNPSIRAAALAAQGEVATDEGDAARGAELARTAMAAHVKLNNPAAANKDRNDLGLALAAMGDKNAARAAFHESLDAARASHDAQQEAASLSNIARALLGFGDIDEAVQTYLQARSAARRSGDHDVEATATGDLGMAYHAQGDESDAVAELNAAIALRQQAHDPRGEAIDRNDLALVKSDTGDPQAALDIFTQTRALFVELSDSYEEAATLNNIGTVYRGLGARDEARRYFEQAEAIDTRTHDDESLAVVLNNLAVVALSGDEAEDAERYIERALEIEQKLGDRVAQASLLSGLAMARDNPDDHAAAVDRLNESLKLAQETGSVHGQALALHNRGAVRERMGDLPGALADLQAALPLWHRIGDAPGEAAGLFVIARIEAAQGHVEQALADVEAAIALNESERGRIKSEDKRATFLVRAGAAYELRTELLMRLDKTKKALEAAEAARGRSLLDLLTEAQARVLQRADPALARQLSELRRSLSAKAAKQAAAAAGQSTENEKDIAREIDDLLAEQDRVEAAIRAGNPAAASLTAPPPMTLADIQAGLDPDTILLDYTLGEKRSFMFVVSPTSLRAYELPARGELVAAAKALRSAIIDAPDDAARFQAASARLGDMLLGQASDAINGKRLVIIADAALQSRVPFTALTLPANAADHGKLLVETNEVVAEPSAAALAALRRVVAGRPHPPGGVAIFADPVVSPDDPRLPPAARPPGAAAGSVAQAAAGGAPSRLPATRDEADAILALVGPGGAHVWIGFDATREAAEDPALAGYRILHFALHGLTNATTPALSGLLFSLFAPDGATRDGYLRLADVFALTLPVDLAVLSACQSGLGRDVGGEGLVGLSRGFLYAGAARLVTSLWDVEDASTADLMGRFYAAMLGPRALPPAAALRAAQRETLAAGRWTAPLHWAAFTVQGEWR